MALGGLPHVEIREIDLSIVPKLTQQFISAGVIVSPRGSLLPRFVGDSATLRAKYFPIDKRFHRGLDTSLLEVDIALQKSAFWIVRAAHNDIKYSGADILAQDDVTDTSHSSSWSTSKLNGYTQSGDVFNPDEDGFDWSASPSATAVIIAESPGKWGNDIKISIKDGSSRAPNTQLIEVYVAGELVEKFYVSTDPSVKLPSGQTAYLPTVLKQSAYVRGFVNPAKQGKKLEEVVGLQLGGGDDGSAVTTGDKINALNQLAGEVFKFQLLPDLGTADPAYAIQLIQLAQEKRSLALLSVPYEAVASSSYVSEILDYRQNQLSISGNLASFGGLYGNWLKVYVADISDSIYVSPTSFATKTIAYTWANYNPWEPPAGFKKGFVTALDVRRRMKISEMGQLYEAGVNPIRFAPGKGLAIFGQKTLYPFLSALDRINVRLLLNYIELIGKEFLESFIFDLNNQLTWDLVESGLKSLLQHIKDRGGLYDFKVFNPGDVTTPLDIDNYIMRVPVAVQPVKSVEWIDFTIGITRTGGNMDVVANI